MTTHSDRLQVDIERQLFASVVFLIRISQFVGTAPLGFTLQSLTSSASADNQPKLRQRLAQFAHYAWSAILVLLLFVSMFYESMLVDRTYGVVEGFLFACSYTVVGITSVIVLVGSALHRTTYAIVFRRIVRIDRQFVELLSTDTVDRLQYANIGRTMQRDLLILTVLLVSMMAITLYNTLFDLVLFLRSVIVHIVSQCTVCTCLMQYAFGLRVLRVRYALLNDMLSARLSADRSSAAMMHLLGDVRIVREAGRRPRTVEHDEPERTLNQLRRLHCQLDQLHSSLMQGFGAMLIANFVVVCLGMTVVFFTTYLIASSAKRHLSGLYGLYSVLWLMLYVVRGTLVLGHSELVSRQRSGAVAPLYRLECEQRERGTIGMRHAVRIGCDIVCIKLNLVGSHRIDQHVLSANAARSAAAVRVWHTADRPDAAGLHRRCADVLFGYSDSVPVEHARCGGEWLTGGGNKV